ncbi:MAG: hypothetical protein RL272_432 [Candidatus Parcubacteria bacterium]
MKKLRYFALLFVVAAAGFAFGRLTGTASPIIANIHKEFPLFPAPPKPVNAPMPAAALKADDKDVILEMPLDGDRPSDASFEVSGRAKAGGASVLVTVKDAQGDPIYGATSDVVAGAGEPYGRFSQTVRLAALPTGPVTLEVRRTGDASAAPVTRLVVFGSADEIPVKIYFPNGTLDPKNECSVVFPVDRMVSGKVAIYRAVTEELLKGPSPDDAAAGYRTAIPGNVILKSVAADAAGVVTADFDGRLSKGGADSCVAQAIKAQIGATLRQFPEVHDVVIAINGRTDGILEP